MNKALHFSSRSGEWETPQAFFDRLNAEFNFMLDLCAQPATAKCPHFYTTAAGMEAPMKTGQIAEHDAFAHEWRGTCFMNPPYGRGVAQWLRKAHSSASLNSATVVALIPSRTDTAYWHDYVMEASEVRLVRGRLKFGGCLNAAPFPSAVVIFRPDYMTHAIFKSLDNRHASL